MNEAEQYLASASILRENLELAQAENKALRQHQTDYMEAAEETRRALQAELETERLRLAACGVVAMANTRESAAEARKMHPDYWSASCENVADMVDSEMKLREENATLRRGMTGDYDLDAWLDWAKEAEALRARVVVMPERERVGDHSDYGDQSGLHWAEGWNDCLDELARLNGKTVSEGTLREAKRHLGNWLELHECECEGGFHYCGRDQVAKTHRDLRTLLDTEEPKN